MSVVMHGAAAELRVGWQLAAELGDWELTGSPDGWVCVASVRDQDAYWCGQEPLDLRLSVGRASWQWKSVSVALSGDTATITGTGRPEVR